MGFFSVCNRITSSHLSQSHYNSFILNFSRTNSGFSWDKVYLSIGGVPFFFFFFPLIFRNFKSHLTCSSYLLSLLFSGHSLTLRPVFTPVIPPGTLCPLLLFCFLLHILSDLLFMSQNVSLACIVFCFL